MPLNYTLLLRLEEISLRKVVVMLWSKTDIVTLGKIEICSTDPFGMFKRLLEKYLKQIEELSVLVLPKLLSNKVKPLFKPIGSDIMKWIYFHVQFLRNEGIYSRNKRFVNYDIRFDRNIFNILSWTSLGTINYKKTAQELIRHEILEVFLLYKLACLYCLEDYIPVIWEKLPFKNKMQISDNVDLFQTADLHVKDFWEQLLFIDCFTFFNDDNIDENVDHFYQHALKLSSYTKNEAATEYFYQKLSDAQKEVCLVEIAEEVAKRDHVYHLSCLSPFHFPREKYSNILCYLLSKMIPEQQMELFKSYPYNILSFFLVWPWQDLFLDVAELMWDFLPQKDYYFLLQDLHETDAIPECVKEVLFKEFFKCSPGSFKNYVIDQECESGNFLDCLFRTEKSELIRCILGSMDASAKLRLVFCKQGRRICLYLILEDKWALLKLFIKETLPSKEDRERFKDYLKPYIFELIGVEKSNRKIQAFEQLLHMFTETGENRTLED